MDRSRSAFLSAWHSSNVDQAKFGRDLTKDPRKIELAKKVTTIQDIQTLVNDVFAKYSDERKFPRTRKWMMRIISKIHHYGNIMDVMVQHHPEYVALGWGAMKMVLVSAQNHEATICAISKALSQIADKLPQVELATVLYPTEMMREAVGKLYANLLRFFIRAHEWCEEGRLRHLLHSITRPVELRYKDLLDDIDYTSRHISQLASAGTQVRVCEIDIDWSTAQESKVAILKGNFNARFAMRDFSVNIIQQLLSKNVPVLWALSGPDSGSEASSDISPVDLFQHLILQALRLDRDSQTESGMSLQCARFHGASTEHDWLQLLGSSLVGIREVYLVVDLSTLRGNVESTDGFSWPAAFNSLFVEIAKRSQGVRIKVLLLAGMTSEGAQASVQAPSDILIPKMSAGHTGTTRSTETDELIEPERA
ncbi:hypothetical protein SAPIO_CDS9108 [Scedosporium apiospermum]|uniref:DUF7708 domain-containing protein n=1 Tax=Pseudallescheria apiosperma TaxID=563466 RepID=A0A084FYD2_PSEDA|nr:uncharacterized protein SAPIO_CDS9108 [Scedosporium apiospermum]KEZ40094.1 hypothetical protein SAPIO_CDS9108 [Scedosporium apiospermum]